MGLKEDLDRDNLLDSLFVLALVGMVCVGTSLFFGALCGIFVWTFRAVSGVGA